MIYANAFLRALAISSRAARAASMILIIRRKPWIMPGIARHRHRHARLAQPRGVRFALVTERVVFRGDDESRRQLPWSFGADSGEA